MKRFLVPIVAVALGAPFAAARAGLWYMRTIDMREAHDRPFQWESFWASLTFTVR